MRHLYTKIKNLIKRGYVSKLFDDSNTIPAVEVSYLGKNGIAELLNPYGFNAMPPLGTQVLIFSVNSVEANRICLAYSQKNRFKNLNEGEVVVGNPVQETYIKFDDEGDIIVEVKRDFEVNVQRNVKVTVGRDMDIDISGGRDINIDIARDMNADIDRDLNLDVARNININIPGNINITNANTVNVDASQVNLGTGGAAIARAGDPVQVNLGTGIGTITAGGTNTSI